jgi:hypothetical protein
MPVACAPDGAIQELAKKLQGTPRAALPKAFLQHALREYALDAAFAPLMLVSTELGVKAGSQGCGLKKAAARTSERLPWFASKATRNEPWTFAEAAAAVKTAWETQRAKSPFDDTIFLVLISPQDPDDYIALGGRRVYWIDDDVASKEHAHGVLHAIEYFAGDGDERPRRTALTPSLPRRSVPSAH